MLAFDEEVDYLEYQQYLRSQSDSELFDIVDHLDLGSCPRRTEAARKELARRDVFLTNTYSESENIWRNVAIVAIFVTALTLLLSLTMSRDEAITPQPPPSLDLTATGSFFQFSSGASTGDSQMSAAILGVYVWQLGENVLRDAVQTGSRFGIYLAMLAATGWKLMNSLKERATKDALSQDVRRLMAIAVVAQFLVLVVGGCSQIPRLVNDGNMVNGGFLARAVTLVAPWG